jgi:DNA-binding response OmpR family regulator
MRKRVLLVEDEPNIIEAITFLLSREGWHVDTHVDGATAVARVRDVAPDLLMLDHMLPGKSGLDILTELRSDTAFDALPILMLTARGQMRDRTQAEEAGVSRFMTKPFSNTEVLNAVRDLTHT